MAKAQGEIDVVMGADGRAVMQTMDKIVRRMEEMQRITDAIGASAKKAAAAFNFQPSAKKFDDIFKKFDALEKRMQTMARANITGTNNDRTFATQVRNATEFSRPLRQAQTEAQALQTRLYAIDKQLVELGNKGKTGTQGMMSKRLGLEQAGKDIGKLQNEIKRADDAFAKLGVAGNRGRLTAAENGLFGALTNGRRSNFTKEITELRNARTAYLRELEKTKKDIAAAQKGSPTPSTGDKGGGGGVFGSAGIGGVILRTGAYGAAAAAIYGVIGALKDGITFGLQFEDQMAKISAIAGLTATQTGKLSTTIYEVAAQSRYATQDIAEATTVLAQAGFSAEDIKGSLAAVGNLASASGVTFAEATDVMTSTIGAFQLQASEAARITDVLASALNNTKLNMQQVALGIQYAGATAYEQKISFEELTAVMATMAQAGIRSGSTIGTGLRQFLVDLQTPSKKLTTELEKLGVSMEDIDVKTLGLPEVLNRLADAGFSSASAYKALETRAAAAYIVLKNNRDEIQKQIIAQNQLGLAADAAAKGQDSFVAQWQRFKNILNEEVATNLNSTNTSLKDILKTWNDMASNTALKKMREDLDRLEEGSDAWATQIDKIEAYKASLQETIDIELAHADAMEIANTAVNEANDAFSKQQTTIDSANDAIRKVILREQQLTNDHLALQAETATLTSRFAGLSNELDGQALSYDNLVSAMQDYRRTAIAIGAIKANDQLMAYDQRVRTGASTANDFGNAFMKTSAYKAMPQKLKNAMSRLAANPDGPSAGNDANMLYNYAVDNKDKMNGADNKLIGFARTTSRVGTDKLARNEARNNFEVMGHLGTKHGQEMLTQIDGLTGKPDADIKAWIASNIDNRIGKKGNSASLNKGLELLKNQALAQLGSGTGPEANHGTPKKDHSADKAERENDRREMTIAKERMKAAEAELALALKNIPKDVNAPGSLNPDGTISVTGSRGLTSEALAANVKKADVALDTWIKDRTALMVAEIDSGNMKGEQEALFRAEVQREIAAKTEATNDAIGEGLSKALDAMVEIVDRIRERTEQTADQLLAMSEARLTALDRTGLRGRVPDFVKNHYSRQAEMARDGRDQAQIGINSATIAGYQKAITTVQVAGAISNADPEQVRKDIDALRLKITELSNANDVLKASFGGEALLPQSFSEALGLAVEDFREANAMNLTFRETLQNEIPGALDTAYGATNKFFSDIITGTATVKQAFGSFVKSMIQMLEQMIAKFLAMQAFKFLLSFIPGGSPDITGMAAAPLFNGGSVKGAFRGEHIQTGVPGRDSTLRNLAKGEYVVRKAAVDSVGVGFMNKLNERGAHAVRPAPVVMPQAAQQQMSVYIVKPDTKPQMGPRDVLLTIHDDILKDGQTKRLIKHVAQGG